ncbi:hypothetical protein CLV63_1303 [Murinocardiopsis flavida]|uniref:Uncharacterized protein n=1 Tax=Murinocardiopsis flavida TaxID=645275 RepID=A0A2P8CSU6_9ACTN|nr:hypothetical protein [Murinocardiopsis flavida]PSK88041.1 hypothetical protein CLV63_1303 [Murinocardiopsis flavida]
MTVQQEFRAVLESGSRDALLRALGHRLGISAREIFAEQAPDALSQARACNEMMIALWAQTDTARRAGVAGYPDAEFLAILRSKADTGGARVHLRRAVEGALAVTRGPADEGEAPRPEEP